MKDPVSIFGCWRGFQFVGALAARAGRRQGPLREGLRIWRGGSDADCRAAEPHPSIIPGRHDRHYDEIVRGFGNGALRAPATPMSDSELARAIADFLEDSPSAETVSSLGRRFDPSSPL